MKKADYILIILVLLAAAIVFAYNSYSIANQGNSEKYVLIQVNSEEFGRYNLSENLEIEIVENENYNKVKIENGRVSMIDADCHDQICVKTKKISRTGESIVCLPHRVLVTIESEDSGNFNDGDEIDVISQ